MIGTKTIVPNKKGINNLFTLSIRYSLFVLFSKADFVLMPDSSIRTEKYNNTADQTIAFDKNIIGFLPSIPRLSCMIRNKYEESDPS